MKYLIPLLLLVCSCSAADKAVQAVKGESDYDKQKRQQKEIAHSMQTGDCYSIIKNIEPKFSFEKAYLYKSPVLFVLAVDPGKGALMAQPDPECGADLEDSAKCEYWFRSMEMADPFLIWGKEAKVSCPAGINRAEMIKRLKDSKFAKEFNLKGL